MMHDALYPAMDSINNHKRREIWALIKLICYSTTTTQFWHNPLLFILAAAALDLDIQPVKIEHISYTAPY